GQAGQHQSESAAAEKTERHGDVIGITAIKNGLHCRPFLSLYRNLTSGRATVVTPGIHRGRPAPAAEISVITVRGYGAHAAVKTGCIHVPAPASSPACHPLPAPAPDQPSMKPWHYPARGRAQRPDWFSYNHGPDTAR